MWPQRTRLYLGLAIVVSVVPFTLAVLLRSAAAPWTLPFLSAAYVVTAVLIRRRAEAVVRQDLALAA